MVSSSEPQGNHKCRIVEEGSVEEQLQGHSALGELLIALQFYPRRVKGVVLVI